MEKKKFFKDSSKKKFSLAAWCNKNKLILLAVLVILLVIFPQLPISPYILRIATLVMLYSTLAVALNLISGYTGQISLGHAMFFGIGAYTTAIMVTKLGFSWFATIPFSILISAIVGLLVGLPSLRLSGSYLAIVTMGFAEVVKMVFNNWTPVTNGVLGVKNIPQPELFGIVLKTTNGGMYYLILVIMLLVSVFVYLLVNSKYGRAFRMIKGDPLAATVLGVNTTYYKVLAFVISAMLTSIVGSYYASFQRFINASSFTFDTSILILSIVVLGGMGTMRGMYLGAAVLIILPEALRSMEGLRFVIYGLCLVLVMRFRPQGLLGGEPKVPYAFPKGVDATKKIAASPASGQEV
jgi:branched-chain amino acid transport system permease protein